MKTILNNIATSPMAHDVRKMHPKHWSESFWLLALPASALAGGYLIIVLISVL